MSGHITSRCLDNNKRDKPRKQEQTKEACNSIEGVADEESNGKDKEEIVFVAIRGDCWQYGEVDK